MTTPTQILHHLAGQPEPEKGSQRPMRGERCLVCGAHYHLGVKASDAIPKTDTDQAEYRAPWSEIVCSACAWASAGKPPDTFRMWTVLHRRDKPAGSHQAAAMEKMTTGAAPRLEPFLECSSVCLTNRGNTKPIVDLLLRPPASPWFVAIAISGQVHTARFAVVNRGRHWTVRIERASVAGDSNTFAELLYRSGTLKLAGFCDDDILTGEPSPNALYRAHQLWYEHAEALQPYRHTGLLELALWCHTKESTSDNVDAALGAIAARDDDERSDRHAAGLSVIYPEREDRPEELLVLGAEGAQDRGRRRDDLRTNDFRHAPGTANGGHPVQGCGGQTSLFDWTVD
jgi:hypothetical protein